MTRKYTVTRGEQRHEVEVWQEGDLYCVRLGAKVHQVSLSMINGGHLYSLLLDGRSYEVYAKRHGTSYELLVGDEPYELGVRHGYRPAPSSRPSEAAGAWVLRSPMTGIVIEVAVQPGQVIERGTVMLVLESMKMNNELRAERGGTVQAISVQPGQHVERGTPLVHLGQ
ncbi:MAG: acetyl-CoA carboxylase biotin carboxyl carrier protein subunit [Dehalococcoidia bacterium]